MAKRNSMNESIEVQPEIPGSPPVEAAPAGAEQGRRVRHVPTTPAEIMVAKMKKDASTAARVISQIQNLPVDVRRIVVGAVATISTEG